MILKYAKEKWSNKKNSFILLQFLFWLFSFGKSAEKTSDIMIKKLKIFLLKTCWTCVNFNFNIFIVPYLTQNLFHLTFGLFWDFVHIFYLRANVCRKFQICSLIFCKWIWRYIMAIKIKIVMNEFWNSKNIISSQNMPVPKKE